MFGAQSLGYGCFSDFAIRPRGRRGNVAFSLQSLAKFLVRTADVFVERVSATCFVAS
jgi:hypothetical protein